ncbi:unnamed protein product [Dovyalis caffra]|uniref:PIN domain-containing protein n=1 Tax=Dovyalis caffra TaxID=77055 RepID=A0AAV1RZ51_9ROSI|nr:unnamed protein product [Dovyalis caffra]
MASYSDHQFVNPVKGFAPKKRRGCGEGVDNEDDQKGRGERASKKRKKMGRVDFKKLGLDPAPNFSSQIKARIDYQEGHDSAIKKMIMKQIFITDLNMHHDCFSMPLNQMNDFNNFLKKNEIEGIKVMLVELSPKDDNVHQSTMRLRKLNINKNISYVLTTKWNDVLKRNEGVLNENDIVMDVDKVDRRVASKRTTSQENNNVDHGAIEQYRFFMVLVQVGVKPARKVLAQARHRGDDLKEAINVMELLS